MSKKYLSLNIEWEQFRRRTTPVLFPIAYYFRPYTIKSGHFPPVSIYAQFSYQNRDRQALIEKKSFDSLQRWLVKKLLREPQLMAKQVRKGRQFAKRWLRWCRQSLTPESLHKASLQKLSRLYRRYQHDYEQYSLINIFYYVFTGDRLIEELDKAITPFISNSDERQQILLVLTTPDTLSFIQHEEQMFLRLAKRAPTMSQLQIKNALARHSLDFGWIPWDYVGPTYWTPVVLGRRLTNLRRRKSIDEQLHTITHHLKQTRIARINAERTLKLPGKIKAIATGTRAQAVLQDDKKAVTTESHYYLHFIQREAGRRLHVPWRQLYYASFEEIICALEGGKLPNLIN